MRWIGSGTISFGRDANLVMGRTQSLKGILFRVAIWSMAFATLIWASLQVGDDGDDGKSFIFYVALAGGIFFGTGLGRAIADLLSRLGLQFSKSTKGEVARITFWLLFIGFAGSFIAFASGRLGMHGMIKTIAWFPLILGIFGLLFSVFLVGTSWRAIKQEQTRTLRASVGLRVGQNARTTVLRNNSLDLAVGKFANIIESAIDGRSQ